jgi:hypothetical protein
MIAFKSGFGRTWRNGLDHHLETHRFADPRRGKRR